MRKLMHSKVKHSKAAATWRAIARPRGAIPRPRSGAEAWRTPCRKGSSQEELPHVGGEGQQPRIPDCDGAGTAERSYPASEVRGCGREELPHTPKPEARGGGREELPHTTKPKAREDGQEELPHAPTPEARGSGQEEQHMPEARSCDERSYLEPGSSGAGGPRGAIPH